MGNLKIENQRVMTHDGKLILGHISQSRFGWHFIPASAGRKTSRKYWPTGEAAIPAWAKKVAKHYKETGSVL